MLHMFDLVAIIGFVTFLLLDTYRSVLSKWEFFIKLRAAYLLSPSFITQGRMGASKAALILMKNSHFDRTLQYTAVFFKASKTGDYFDILKLWKVWNPPKENFLYSYFSNPTVFKRKVAGLVPLICRDQFAMHTFFFNSEIQRVCGMENRLTYRKICQV